LDNVKYHLGKTN